MTAKKKEIQIVHYGAHLNNVSIVNNTTPANEFTRDAVVALAEALSRNADAIKEAALALKGGNAEMETGIKIEGAK